METPALFSKLLTIVLCAGAIAASPIPSVDKAGYTDTPMLPGGKWHVHDPNRPDAKPIDPGSGVPAATPGMPPSDAVVLFDGTDLSKWRTLDGKPPAWIVRGGYAEVPPAGTANGGDIRSVQEFGACQIHVEWLLPAVRPGEEHSFERGNSGVFLQGLYEVQIFDSFNNDYLYSDGQAGGIYGQYPPLVNASRAPLAWQSYDIVFRPARFEGGKLATPAYATVFQNGVCVHDHAAILGPSGHRILAKYDRELPPVGPLALQAHGSAVRFRNVWVRPLGEYP